VGLALGANIGAVALAVAGSAWLWARAAESGLPSSYGHSATPVLEEVQVPLAVDPRGRAHFEPRIASAPRLASPSRPRKAAPGRQHAPRVARPARGAAGCVAAIATVPG
jgi:hypothetical protein